MLALSTPRKNRPSRCRAIALLCLVGCSALPHASFPEFVDHDVRAEFVVPAAGRLHLPATTRSLVVRTIGLEPAPLREQFDAAGGRWFVYPAGTTVRVRCQLRAYADANGLVPSLDEILHHARHIERLTSP